MFDPADLENVKAIQDKYIAQPLSAFLKQKPPKAAAAIAFPKPLSAADQKISPAFFDELNFLLQFAPSHPSETALRVRFASIGIAPGKQFDPTTLSPEMKTAVEAGMTDAWVSFAAIKARVDHGEVLSGDIFGTREFLQNDYQKRMAAAVLGIYGNSKQEAMYPAYFIDSSGQKLDGANRYTLQFAPGQLPPVNSFWSLTMYEQPASLLVVNPINRYLLNSPMLSSFKTDAEGGITLIVQNASPDKDYEANWLPAPKGPFSLIMRLYWPKPEALDGRWTSPKLVRVQ